MVPARVGRRALTRGTLVALLFVGQLGWSHPAGRPDRGWASAFGPDAGDAGAAAATTGLAPSDPVPAPAEPPPAATMPTWNLVGVGDSVLTHCSCAGVLADYAELAAGPAAPPIRVSNVASPGATSASVLRSLDEDEPLRGEVAKADTVVVLVGANDFAEAFDAVSAGASPHLFTTVAETLHRNLSAILDRIRALRGDRNPALVCGYWNDFKDGNVAAQEYSPARRRAAAEATEATNNAIQAAAQAAGAVYVSTAAAFAEHPDPSDLLDPDGDHLSALGSRLIATALAQAGARPTRGGTAG